MIKNVLLLIAALPLLCFCQSDDEKENLNPGGIIMELKSSAFQEEGMIPQKYTCDGENISPPLSWNEVPEGTESFALIADDPDAPGRTFVHWVIYNIPASTTEFPEGVPNDSTVLGGAEQGENSSNKTGYMGPCPPSGTHRYFFKLYALDKKVEGGPGLSKSELIKAMKDHVLAEGQLMGKYQR
jgi:Raf kinase inhibitor-like YbhB/YbcL family protein